MQSCNQDFGNLTYKAKLPTIINEASGIEFDASKNAFWLLNDSNNPSEIYLVTEKGKIKHQLKINTENIDWEDITKDALGNIYIGDFGNNNNERRDLHIIKIDKKALGKKQVQKIAKTYFYFPEQKKFPPSKRYYDVEAFFEYKQFFYIFTKSRVKNEIGKTKLYKVPNKIGKFAAEFISEILLDTEQGSWITAADISNDGKKVALLNHYSVCIFTNFKGDNFLSGTIKKYNLNHKSQKEAITFTNDSTLFIADERLGFSGGNLYAIQID